MPAQPQPWCCCAQSLETPQQDSSGAPLSGSHRRRLELETETSVVQHPCATAPARTLLTERHRSTLSCPLASPCPPCDIYSIFSNPNTFSSKQQIWKQHCGSWGHVSLTSRATAALACPDSLLQSNVPSAQPAGQGAAHSQSQTMARSLLTERLHKPMESGQDTSIGKFFSFTNYMEKVTHTLLQQSLLRITLQL